MKIKTRKYKPLKKQVFSAGDYKIVPIRDKDKYEIMKWRNEQMYHLRQNEILTKEKQEEYFKKVVAGLFEKEKPEQILFSYLKNDQCNGYGGLVHIDWEQKTAELSFIMDTRLEKNEFEKHWLQFVRLIKQVAFGELNFKYIFTYAFDLRPHLYPVLEKAGFQQVKRLKNEIEIDGKKTDVVIHQLKAETMNILFLGYTDSPLISFLKKDGNKVYVTDNKIDPSWFTENEINLVISYGYRHIIKPEILGLLPGKFINLHISYLPYNRGADPNFWSFVENTPKGVSIHLIDEGVDTGDILIQKQMEFSIYDESLRTSYDKLQKEIQQLFKTHWEDIKNGEIQPKKQQSKGTYHRKKDKNKFIKGIENQYLDMKIYELLKYISKNNNK